MNCEDEGDGSESLDVMRCCLVVRGWTADEVVTEKTAADDDIRPPETSVVWGSSKLCGGGCSLLDSLLTPRPLRIQLR
ncbi:hypothetical protein HanPI659440_Chr04g0171611 [Helianthus annuus]|nr:hypothetical protein HanPI659440_Chr04g0171611 [Helianthus annuus]